MKSLLGLIFQPSSFAGLAIIADAIHQMLVSVAPVNTQLATLVPQIILGLAAIVKQEGNVTNTGAPVSSTFPVSPGVPGSGM